MFDTIGEVAEFSNVLRITGVVILGFKDGRFRAFCIKPNAVRHDGMADVYLGKLSAQVLLDSSYNGQIEMAPVLNDSKAALLQEVDDLMSPTPPGDDYNPMVYILHDTIDRTLKFRRAARREINPVDITINVN